MSDNGKPLEADKAQEALKAKDVFKLSAWIQEAKDFKSPTQNTFAEAQAGVNEHLDHYTKAQGRAAERSALEKMRANGATLTDLNTRFNTSFPIYDVASDSQVASVKCRGLEQGATPSDSTINTYITDLENATGNISQSGKFDNAVKGLHADASTVRVGYPPELAVSLSQAEKYLRENAKLMIPDDHVMPVRNELTRRLFQDDAMSRQTAASRLGLGDVNAPNYPMRANAMLNRIEGVGVSSIQIKQLLDQSPGIWHDR